MRAALLILAACTSTPDGGWREASEDALFHQEPRWLGADGAYTIDLGDGRVLWLFGDSFVATSPALVRSESTMVRNSVAVMTGHDPATATMQLAWRDGSPPTSFFPEDGDHWFWPNDGVREPDGTLVVFLSEVRATPNQGLGFAGAGYRAVSMDPSGPPGQWQLAPVPTTPAPFDATANVTCTAVDGNELVAVFSGGHLARWPLGTLDLSAPQWSPAVVIPDASSECSLQRVNDHWVYVQSRGFGATTIAVRTATRLDGPWSDPVDVFTPPESAAPNAFVYAGKGHPTLATHEPGANLVITYADNSFTFADLFDPARAQTLYWPHVAELALQ
jgi:hypothetical protein